MFFGAKRVETNSLHSRLSLMVFPAFPRIPLRTPRCIPRRRWQATGTPAMPGGVQSLTPLWAESGTLDAPSRSFVAETARRVGGWVEG